MLDYLQDLQKMNMNQKLVDNLRSSLSSHLIGQKSSKTILAKDIICTLATSQSIGSSKEVVKILGVDKKNIKITIRWRDLLNASRFTLWTTQQHTKRSNVLFESTKNLVRAWWTIETTISPNHKDITWR